MTSEAEKGWKGTSGPGRALETMQAISRSRHPSSALHDKNQIARTAAKGAKAPPRMADRIVRHADVLTKSYTCVYRKFLFFFFFFSKRKAQRSDRGKGRPGFHRCFGLLDHVGQENDAVFSTSAARMDDDDQKRCPSKTS